MEQFKVIKERDLEFKEYLPNGIKIYSESEFLDRMEKDNKFWRDTFVKGGYFTSFNKAKLRFYYAVPKEAKKVVVIVHGFCEFWGKYHELAEYLYKGGYGIFFLEQRGHGLSEREVEDIDTVHINNFKDYVKDLKCFMDKVVLPKADGRETVLFAHSMGGAVSTLFMEKYPDYFKKAILSSPMMKLRTGKIPMAAIDALSVYVKARKKQDELAFNQSHFDPTPIFEKSSTLSKPRYDYLFEQRLRDDHYKTYGGTYMWEFESIKAGKMLLKYLPRIKTEVVIIQAGKDHLVDVEGYTDTVLKNLKGVRIIRYEDSKHEVFNSTPKMIYDFYKRFFEELN